MVNLERLLRMHSVEGRGIKHVKAVNSTKADVKCVNSLTGTGNVVVRDPIPNAAPRHIIEDNLDNVSPVTLRNAISDITLLIKDLLGNLLSQALANTTCQPNTTLEGSMNRLVGESLKTG